VETVAKPLLLRLGLSCNLLIEGHLTAGCGRPCYRRIENRKSSMFHGQNKKPSASVLMQIVPSEGFTPKQCAKFVLKLIEKNVN
jgi:hypothetical protein